MPQEEFSLTLDSAEWAAILMMLEGKIRPHPVDSPLLADKIRTQIARARKEPRR